MLALCIFDAQKPVRIRRPKIGELARQAQGERILARRRDSGIVFSLLLCYTNLKKGGERVPHGYKRIKNDIFYFRQDHFCPGCGTKLEKVPVSKVVNSKSPEAKDFDFSMAGGTYMIGDIQFTWDEFECPACKRHLSVNEMKEIEGVPLPQKSGKLAKVLFYIIGLLFVIAVVLIKKYL